MAGFMRLLFWLLVSGLLLVIVNAVQDRMGRAVGKARFI